MTLNPYKSLILLHVLSTRHPHSFAESGFSKEGTGMNLSNKYPYHLCVQVSPTLVGDHDQSPFDLNP